MQVVAARGASAALAVAVIVGLSGAAAAQQAGGMNGMKTPMGRHVTPRPGKLDTSTSKTTENRHYFATLLPESKPVRINQMHRWLLTLRTADGEPVEGATIAVDGGMPDHGHGLPTSPGVTRYLGDGRYLVDGVRFNMTGWWQLRFVIAGAEPDRVTFNLDLK